MYLKVAVTLDFSEELKQGFDFHLFLLVSSETEMKLIAGGYRL
jgi:hypothetical protein